MVERSLELFEHSSVLDQVCLHLWCNLLVKLELFDNEVEVIKESLLNVFSNIIIKGRLDMERFVRLLNLLDPHVERVKLLFDKGLKRVGCIEDTVDGPHQEGEEGEADELKGDREDVFLVGLSRVVTVTDCRDDFKDPIESEDILGVVRLKLKIISIYPRSYTIFLQVGIFIPT